MCLHTSERPMSDPLRVTRAAALLAEGLHITVADANATIRRWARQQFTSSELVVVEIIGVLGMDIRSDGCEA